MDENILCLHCLFGCVRQLTDSHIHSHCLFGCMRQLTGSHIPFPWGLVEEGEASGAGKKLVTSSWSGFCPVYEYMLLCMKKNQV